MSLNDCEAIVHIGTEKTGTTSLQKILYSNRADLEDQGFYYPETVRGNHRHFGVVSYNPKKRDDVVRRMLLNFDGDISDLKDSVLSSVENELRGKKGKKLLLSAEHFHSRLREPNEISNFRSFLCNLGYKNIGIVVYLRNPVELAQALLSTAVRTGQSLKYPPKPSSEYWSNLCDHKQTLEKWSSIFGKEHVYPRLYDKDALLNGNVINDFCSILNISSDSWERPENTNFSLSNVGVRVLSTLNYLIREGRFSDLKIRGVNRAVEQYLDNGVPYRIPEEVARDYHEAFFSSSQWVEDRYFGGCRALSSIPVLGDDPFRGSDEEMEMLCRFFLRIIKSIGQER